MPGTPSFQQRTSPHNGHVNDGENAGAYTSKDHLVPPIGVTQLGKALSPLHGTTVYHDATTNGQGAQRVKNGLDENGKGALTSQFDRGARNGIKEEEEGEGRRLAAAILSLDHLFSTCFKSTRTRAWEKSRRIEESDLALTREELNEQLRPEEEGLVPLNAIAGRVVLYGWQLFANQVEINASLSPLKRRKRIYDDAHEARKQLIKLLVLSQWSKVAPELQLARSLIAFINDHITQTDESVQALGETRKLLTNVRLRNSDLVTAIEVLGTGAPQRIPPLIKDAIQSRKAYTDAEAIELVKELDGAIRLRLACGEILPTPMMSYSISDGRACFKVPTLFEADLTLSGSASEDRWWLLRVKFDFKVTGEGVDRFPRQPKKNQRLHLLSLADTELAPRSVAAIPEQNSGVQGGDRVGVERGEAGKAERGSGEGVGDVEMRDSGLGDDSVVAVRRDAPLVRLYNLLQSQALQYRLDILHFQALQQVKFSWGRRLSVRMEAMRLPRTLRIAYWQRLDTDGVTDGEGWRPNGSASLSISVQERARESGTEKVLERLSTKADRDTSEHGRGQIPERQHVQVEWVVDGPASDHLASKEVKVDPQDLNAETLLLNVTSRHAEAAVKAIKVRISSSRLARLMDIQSHSRLTLKGAKEHYLQLTLSDTVALSLHVDQMSGQIRLADSASDSSAWAAQDWLKRLREASSRVNERPDQIVTILQALRTKVLLQDLEEKSTLLGIPITTRMPLRQADYAKLHAKPGTLLYIALVQCPGYYLVIQVGEEAIGVALMCAGTYLEDLMTSMRIVSLEWLDWHSVVASPSTLGKRKRSGKGAAGGVRMSQKDLSKLYSYSVALIYYHKVEEQLRARGLAFVHVGGRTNLQGPPRLQREAEGGEEEADLVSDLVPSLCLRSSAVLDAFNRDSIKRNISIRLHQWWDPVKAHIAFSIRLKLKEGLVSKSDIYESSQEKIEFDSRIGVLTFSIRDIANCVTIFLSTWKRIERVLDLAKEVLSERQKANGFFQLEEFDLLKLRFAYADGLVGEVRWVQDVAKQRGGCYDLTLDAVGDKVENPHKVIRSTLVTWLNTHNDSSPTFWRTFLALWQRLLPILQHIYTFPDRCCEEVECPELVVQHAARIRLVFMQSYCLDVQLIKGNKILFSDGAALSASTSALRSIGSAQQPLQQQQKDDFSLDEEEESSSATEMIPTVQSGKMTIPTLDTILSDLLSQYNEAHRNTNDEDGHQGSHLDVLVFPNGLLCSDHPPTIDWFLPRLIERIQKVVDK